MKNFILAKNKSSEQTYIRQVSDTINNYILTANVGQVAIVPTSGQFVLFGSNGNFFAKPNIHASGVIVPSSAITATGQELNPSSWSCQDVTGIGLIASADTIVSLSFYTA